MITFNEKICILFNDIAQQLKYRLLVNKKPSIIWGRSPYLEFGPGIRTRRLKNNIEKKTINKTCIYMQSHWPWYDIIFYTFCAKILKIKIVFNQNGIYRKNYNKNYRFHNFILIFGILNSNYIIFQSWFCYKSIINITPHFLKGFINSKQYRRILNPTINYIHKNTAKNKTHKILICNSFRSDITYYSKYICELSLKLKNEKYIKEINIVGNIKANINEKEIKKLLNSKNIKLHSQVDNKIILEIIKNNTIVIHLNDGDACPNFISEVISFGIPCILNSNGGGKEISSKACICPKNKLNLNGHLMPNFYDVKKSLNEMIMNYSEYRNYAIKRGVQLNLKKYVNEHIQIINSL